MIENILIYIFLAIFVLTAVITLCSLPGWIDIGEWYKKKLFLALILEVVGCIVLMFRNTVNPDIVEPCYDENTEIILKKEENNEFGMEWKDRNTFRVSYQDSIFIGNISTITVEDLGLTNQINTNYGTINDYTLLDFRIDNGVWKNKQPNLAGSPIDFVIYNNDSNNCYRFTRNGETIPGFDFKEPGIFDVNNRRLHIIDYTDPKDNNKYYCFYKIVSADLSDQTNMFVRVVVFRINTTLKYNEKTS